MPFSLNAKISKEDISIATELAKAADEAGKTIGRRQLRKIRMDRCAEEVEKICLSRKQHHQGELGETIPSCPRPNVSPDA